ncbi:hypothetical protein QZJ86_12165 [Methylomonas montana]|uniref:hypothetical protein n=1 Tax=Methylomonas montana TaxID=3058963 RepID=UPI0026585F91|nr:hypothetical protein [Methylomonas montana]WKJ88777.1 hypothetical protein QZJ86_12165 [Methylomonas montana]
MNEIQKLQRLILRTAGKVEGIKNLMFAIALNHPNPQKILQDFEDITAAKPFGPLELDAQEGLDSIRRELRKKIESLAEREHAHGEGPKKPH